MWKTRTTNNQQITKAVTTPSATAPTVVKTIIPLQTRGTTVTLNAGGTFTVVETTTFDSNYETNFLPENWYYSTSTVSLSAPTLVMTSAYTTYQDNYGYAYYFANGTLGSSTYSYSSGLDYTIGTTSTTYNGSTVYPVTWNTKAGSGGKTKTVCTSSGTWVANRSSDSPTSTSTNAYLTATSSTSVAYTYNSSGAVDTTTTTTYAIDPSTNPISFSASKILDETGRSTYACNLSGTYYYLQ